MKHLSPTLLAVCLCLALAAGCGKDESPEDGNGTGNGTGTAEQTPPPPPPPTAEVVKVGFVAPLGAGSDNALMMKRGLADCLDKRQSADPRRKVELVELTFDRLEQAVADRDIDILVGGTSPDDSARLARLADSANRPAVLGLAPSTSLSADDPWAFFLSPTPEGMARGLARHLNQTLGGGFKAAVLVQTGAPQRFDLADAFVAVLDPAATPENPSQRVVSRQTVSRPEQLPRALRRIAFEQAAVCFVAADEAMLMEIEKANREVNEGKVTLVAVLGHTDPAVFGDNARAVTFAVFNRPALDGTMTVGPYEAMGFDAGAVILSAVQRSVELTPDLLRAALATTRDVKGRAMPGGATERLITFGRTGYTRGREFWIGHIDDTGQVVFDKQVESMAF